MDKSPSSAAIVFTKRVEMRDAVRKVMKTLGLKAEDIINVSDEKECLAKIQEIEFAMLVLDWEYGPEKVQQVLMSNRKESRMESHPVFLLAAHDETAIIAVAQEYFIHHISIGEVNSDTIREQVTALVKEFQKVSPVRKMLLAVEICKRAGDMVNAIEMLERLNALHSNNERVVIELAECYIHADKWDKAEDLLRTMLHMDDVGPRVKHLFARCRLKHNDYNTAIAALKGAQILSPFNTERLLEMGNLFLKMDRLEEAQEAFDDILEFAPNAKDATFGKSTTKLLMGDINEGLQLLNGLASPRELSAVFNTAAILAIRQQRYDAGIALYQKALQLLAKKPKLVARILYNVGIAYVKWSKPEKAMRAFERAVESDPAFTDAAHNLKALKTPSGARSAPASSKEQGVEEIYEKSSPMSLPMIEVGLEHGEEEVELDDVLNDITRVG